jgi:ADP-ribose pyrophosphatase
MKAWQRLEHTKVTKAGFRTVTHKQFLANDGKIRHADTAGEEGASAAAVIALTADNKVVVARQFRCGPEEVMDDLPGGAIDEGETPEQAARRELLEEAGYKVGAIEYIGAGYMDAWSNVKEHYFLATNCYSVGANNPDAFEEIEVLEISIHQLILNAKQGKMIDTLGVFLAYDRLIEMEGKNTI